MLTRFIIKNKITSPDEINVDQDGYRFNINPDNKGNQGNPGYLCSQPDIIQPLLNRHGCAHPR